MTIPATMHAVLLTGHGGFETTAVHSSPPKPGSQAQRPDGEQIPWPEQFEEQSCSTNWHEPPAYPRSQWHAPYTHAPWPEQSPGHAETSIEQSSPA